MPQGDKDKYTDKQKRKAEHIEEGYEQRGVGKKEATARLGDRQQGNRRRQQKWLGARRQGHQRLGEEGRPDRRQGRGPPARGRAIPLGEEGGGDAEAQCRGKVQRPQDGAIGCAQDCAEEIGASQSEARMQTALKSR
jgi:hypothetical protein